MWTFEADDHLGDPVDRGVFGVKCRWLRGILGALKPVSTARPQTFWSMENGEPFGIDRDLKAFSSANAIAFRVHA